VSESARALALERLRAYLGTEGEPVLLRSASPDAWLQDFALAAPWLTIDTDDALPQTVVIEGSYPHGSIEFVGDMEGRLLESVAETLRALATRSIEWDTSATPARVAELAGPVALHVYVGASCPFCPSVTGAALRMACAEPRLSVSVRRADQVADASIQSVPTLKLDGATLHVGAIGEYDLADKLVSAHVG